MCMKKENSLTVVTTQNLCVICVIQAFHVSPFMKAQHLPLTAPDFIYLDH